MAGEADITVRLCTSCVPGSGAEARLAQAIEAAGLQVQVLPQACMNGCARPVSMAVQGQGRATCFFTGIDPDADREDIVATLLAYVDAPGGWIEDARSCGRLRHCLVGRVPAL